MPKELTIDYLKSLLHYDFESGEFTWIQSRCGVTVGNRAGTVHKSGYRYIEIDGKSYAEHRLAWFYCFEEWPQDQIDHIDRIRTNNKLDNLREVNNRQNALNKSVTSKYGHNIYKNKNKFIVVYTINGIRYRYGTYELELATKVRDFVESKLAIDIIPSLENIKEYTKK